MTYLFFLLLFLTLATGQPARPNGGSSSPLRPDSAPPPTRCNPHFRAIDGTCTNPFHKTWASTSRPQFSYTRSSSSRPSGKSLPSARYISNILCTQSLDTANSRHLSEIATFFGQFLDHNLVATPSGGEMMDIPIPRDDPVFANFSGALPFRRSVRGSVGRGRKERPINSLSSAMDLAAIYGADAQRARAMRAFKHGKLATSAGDMLPINTGGLRNAPTNDPRFFLSGDHRVNEHPVLTSFHTLFVREHNKLCDELQKGFPHWTDEMLYTAARKINGAQFQKIVYSEYIPAMTGRHIRRYTGFKRWVNPTVSDIFSTAAFRVGHTMVGNGVNRRGRGNSPMPTLSMQEMFFRPIEVMDDGIEPFLRGALYNKAQEIDLEVHNSLRNFLFTGIPQEKGFDLVALNIQRGRDHALPSYNDIRQIFGLRRVRRFSQITKRRVVQAKLAAVYGHVDRVDPWVGMVAEDHVRGSSLGMTMMAVWGAEFSRLRDGDWYFFRRMAIPREVKRALPQLKRMLYGAETLREIILRNSDIEEGEIGRSVWKVGYGRKGRGRGFGGYGFGRGRSDDDR